MRIIDDWVTERLWMIVGGGMVQVVIPRSFSATAVDTQIQLKCKY